MNTQPVPSDRRPARFGLSARGQIVISALAAFGIAAALAAVLPTNNASAATTLGASAAERGGRYFGTAVAANKLERQPRTPPS